MDVSEKIEEQFDIDCEIVFFNDKQYICYNKWIELIEQEVILQLNKDPNDIKHLMIMGQILYKFKNDYANALERFKQVLILDPKNIDCRLEIVCLMLNKKYLNSVNIDFLLEECFKLDPYYWRIYFVKGMYNNVLDRQYEAIEALNKGNQISPNNLWIIVLLSQMYAYKAKTQAYSEELLKQALQFEKFNYEVLTGISIIYLHFKKYELAEKRLNQVLKLNKNSSAGHSFYAIVLRFLNSDINLSIQYSLQALQINQTNVNSLYNLSHCYQVQQNYDECIKYQKKCLAIIQDPLKVYDKLCYLYMYVLQKYDLVKYYHSKAIKINPNHLVSNMAISSLQNESSDVQTSFEDLLISQIRFLNAAKSSLQDGYISYEYTDITKKMNNLLQV